jgi:nucleoside-diphosphate-sugar epimerase
MAKILITGGSGFVGRHLAKALSKKDKYQIVIADQKLPEGSLRLSNVEYLAVDLTDFQATQKAFNGIEICINLAALIGSVGYMDKYQADIIRDNSLILASTFEAARINHLKWMLYSSSSMIYQQATTWPHQEREALEIPPPKNIYGFSKLLGEYFCRAYHQQYGLNYTILRFFNIYGPGELAKGNDPGFAHVIPDLTTRILSGQNPVELIGSGEQTRCFIHITDVVSAITSILESNNTKNDDFNIGTMDEITIANLASKIWQLSGNKSAIKFKHMPEFAHTTQRRIPDNSKLINATGWQPKISLEQGLTEFIEWQKKSA